MSNKEKSKKKDKLLDNQSGIKTFLFIVLVGLLLFIFDKPLLEILFLKESGFLKSLVSFDYSTRERAIVLFFFLAIFYAILFCVSLKERKILSKPLDYIFILLGLYYAFFLRNDFISIGNYNFHFLSFEIFPAIRYADIFLLLSFLGVFDILLRSYDFFCKEKLESNSVWRNDDPLYRIEEDQMGRSTLVFEISKQINTYSNQKSSFSIGIVSPWGAGKSSFLNFILDEIKKENQNIVLQFNPWLYPDETSLTRAFLSELEIKLKDYSSYLSRDVNDIVDSLFKSNTGIGAFFSNHFKREKSIESIIESLKNSIINSQKRLVIFIDDIDRLQSHEVYEILTILRNVGNLPNTVFVLAYDKDYLLKVMDKNIENPQEYLSKFFQVEFALSRIQDVFIKENLYENLVKIVFENNKDKQSEDKPSLILFRELSKAEAKFNNKALKDLVYGLKSIDLLKNQRDVIKLSNTIAVNWPLTKNELVFEDYLELEILRLKYGNIYSKIKHLDSSWFLNDNDNYILRKSLDHDSLDEEIAYNDRSSIVRAINYLFKSLIPRSPIQESSVCNILSFDLYFQNESFMVKSALNTICQMNKTDLLKIQLNTYYENTITRKTLISYLKDSISFKSIEIFDVFFNFFLEVEEIYTNEGIINRLVLNATYSLGDEIYEEAISELKNKEKVSKGLLYFLEEINQSFKSNNTIPYFITRQQFDDVALKMLDITFDSYNNMEDAFRVFNLNMILKKNETPRIKSHQAKERIKEIVVYNFDEFVYHVMPQKPILSNGSLTFSIGNYPSIIFDGWGNFLSHLNTQCKDCKFGKLKEIACLFTQNEQSLIDNGLISISVQKIDNYPILKSELG